MTKKTIVLQVFDWDKITKTDGIGEVQIPLWQLPRPQSLSCNMETVGRGKVWAGWVWLVQDWFVNLTW